MSSGDLFLLRDQYEGLGVLMENRYFILQSAGAGGFSALAVGWEAGPQVNVKAVITTGTVAAQMIIKNLNNTADFGTVGSSGAGVRTGEQMPPYAAWAFLLGSTDNRIRSGGKRYGLVSEDDQAAGVRDAGIVTAMDGLENALVSSFSSGGNTWSIVMHTEGNLATDQNPLTVAIDTALFVSLSTQSSRKFS
jgi:hypothetical protein